MSERNGWDALTEHVFVPRWAVYVCAVILVLNFISLVLRIFLWAVGA